jgi:hypothetical protein
MLGGCSVDATRAVRLVRYARPVGEPGRAAAAREGGGGGLAREAFAFLSDLAAHNSREWFLEHAAAYREFVERPWLALLEPVAAAVADWLPDLETRLRGHGVLSRIRARWPRPGAAYQTGLRAAFAPRGAPRPPALALTVRLDAAGVRAGAEVRAGTPAWEAARAGAADRSWVRLAAGGSLQWTLNGHPVPALEVAARMAAAGRRAVVGLGSAWDADRAAGLGPALGPAIREALWGALPLYLAAAGGMARGVDGPSTAREARGPTAAPASPAAAPWLLHLPEGLRRPLAAAAERQGVSPEALAVFLLTRAVVRDRVPGRPQRAAPDPALRR